MKNKKIDPLAFLKVDDAEEINHTSKWYAISTYSSHENKVCADLVQKLIVNKIHGDIVDACFVPEIETLEVDKKGNQVIKMKSLAPGYLYIKMIMTDEAWFTIRNTPSVSGFVGSHGKKAKPVPIDEEEMMKVLEACGKTEYIPCRAVKTAEGNV